MSENETHLSKFVEVRLIGKDKMVRFPTEVHKTYCGKETNPSNINNENPSCELCQDWLTWNQIDNIK